MSSVLAFQTNEKFQVESWRQHLEPETQNIIMEFASCYASYECSGRRNIFKLLNDLSNNGYELHHGKLFNQILPVAAVVHCFAATAFSSRESYYNLLPSAPSSER